MPTATNRGDTPDKSEMRACPLVPTEEQWGGLARDMMMWLDFGPPHTPRSLIEHLNRTGKDVPQWLLDEPEMQAPDHSMSKGTRCAIIYRAMVEAAPSRPPADQVSDMVERVAAVDKLSTLRRMCEACHQAFYVSIIDEVIAALQAVPAASEVGMREALKQCRRFLTSAPLESGMCCCGNPVEGHGFSDGHSPVDDLQYASANLVEIIDAALKASGEE